MHRRNALSMLERWFGNNAREKLLLFNRTAHGKPLFARLPLHDGRFGLRNLKAVDAAQTSAFGVNILRNGVRFGDCFVKNGGDDADTEIPCGVVVVEHEDGELFRLVRQHFGLRVKLGCHGVSMPYLSRFQ